MFIHIFLCSQPSVLCLVSVKPLCSTRYPHALSCDHLQTHSSLLWKYSLFSSAQLQIRLNTFIFVVKNLPDKIECMIFGGQFGWKAISLFSGWKNQSSCPGSDFSISRPHTVTCFILRNTCGVPVYSQWKKKQPTLTIFDEKKKITSDCAHEACI